MEQIRVFINNSLTQHVSGTTMPIFRSARPYIADWSLGESGRPAPQGSNQQHQVLETICGYMQSGTPEDGHCGARKMLS